MKNLVDNFAGCKGAGEAGESSCAKGATHSASSLGRDTDRKFIARGHADRLNGNAVRELKKILTRSVTGNLLYDFLGSVEAILFLECSTEGFGKVRHFVKRTYVLNRNPLMQLLSAKCGLAT